MAEAAQPEQLSKNPGAALAWTPTEGTGAFVPRPDRDLKTLQRLSWLGGLIGLDHFYLRSPLTGLAKALTLGGFLLWYIWDIVQVYTEPERVLNRGLAAPMDTVVGIAQGMITDKPTHYTQKSNYSSWALGQMFSMAGLDMFSLGKPGQMLHKLLYLLYATIFGRSAYSSYTAGGTVWPFIAGFITLFFLFIVVGLYIPNVMSIFTPIADLRKKGIEIPESVQRLTEMYRAYMFPLNKEDEARIIAANTLAGVDGAELGRRFVIHHPSEPEDAATQAAKETDENWFKYVMKGTILSPVIMLIEWAWSLISTAKSFTPAGALLQAQAAAREVAEGAASEAMAAAKEQALGGLSGLLKGPTASLDALKGAAMGQIGSLQQTAMRGLEEALPKQAGGARSEELSSEAKLLGATVVALIAGGLIKGVVDYTVPAP
jgi:hypothetical protein